MTLAIHLRRQPGMAARLPGLNVSKLRERSNEFIARDVTRQSHTEITSSRTE